MVDGSRQRFFCLVGGKKNKNKTLRSQLIGNFSLFWLFSDKKTTDWVKKIPSFLAMSEEKIKKNSNVSFFFLVGDIFSSSEDSSTIEYSENALKAAMQINIPKVPIDSNCDSIENQ